MPTRGKKDPNGRALRGRRAHTTFASSVDPAAQIWSNYNVRSGAAGAATPEQPAVQNCLYDRFDALYSKSSIKPSLVIVPARFNSGTLYSEIPTANGDFTVTRATSATRVNASGLIESAKTNLCLQSAGFEVSGTWVPTNTSITTGTTAAFTAPDNSTDADLLTSTSASACNIYQDLSIASGTYTISVFGKAGTSHILSLGNIARGARGAWFNLNAGAVTGTVNGGTASMQNYGNGWYRCIYTSSGIVSGSNTLIVSLSDAANGTTATSGTNLYVWGAQLETGSSASEYIPTTTIARTRFAGVTVDGTSAINIPRLDYFASGGVTGCPALLVEPSGKNEAFHSETWASGSNWHLSEGGTPRVTRATGSTDAFKAPDGTFTANALSPTSGNVFHNIYSNSSTNIAFTSGTIYTQSAFFKAGTGDAGRYVQLTFGSARFTQLGFANFDLQVGAVVASGGTSADTNRNARIENYGNGWYRCSFTATCNVNGTAIGLQAGLITASGATRLPTFAGTVTDVLYGWGAQLEASSVATSYIPTTTAAITRNADLISVSGAVSGSIGQTSGTIYVEFEATNNSTTRRLLTLSDGGQLNRIMLVYVGSAWNAQIQSTTISLGNFTSGYHKIAFAYEKVGVSGNLFASIDGGAVVSGTSATFPSSLSMVNLGKIEDTSNDSFLNARIRAAALYTTRLTNEQLQALTT